MENELKSIKLLRDREKSSKGMRFSVFICTFARSFRVLLFFCSAKVEGTSDMANPKQLSLLKYL